MSIYDPTIYDEQEAGMAQARRRLSVQAGAGERGGPAGASSGQVKHGPIPEFYDEMPTFVPFPSHLDGGCTCAGGGSLHKWVRGRYRWFYPAFTLVASTVFLVSQFEDLATVYITAVFPPVFVFPGLAGLKIQQAAQNVSYWANIKDGYDTAPLASILNGAFSGVWPLICALFFNVVWFFPSPSGFFSWGAVLSVTLQLTKLSCWYLCFAFINLLAFQYGLQWCVRQFAVVV